MNKKNYLSYVKTSVNHVINIRNSGHCSQLVIEKRKEKNKPNSIQEDHYLILRTKYKQWYNMHLYDSFLTDEAADIDP